MRFMVIFVLLGLAGCATSHPPAASLPAPTSTRVSNLQRATVAQVTRYELGSYRYPAAANDGTNENAVLRTTRVPVHNATEANSETFSPVYHPLPRSAELKAELAAQRDITEQLRAMKAAVVAAERKVNEQYSALVSQTEEVLKLRKILEADRAHVRELESQLRQQLQPATSPAVASNSDPASTATEGVKW